MIKKGTLTKECLNMLFVTETIPIIHNDIESFIINDFISKEKLVLFLEGKIPDQIFAHELLNNMLDICFLVEKISSYKPVLRLKMIEFIMGVGNTLSESLNKVFADISNINQTLLDKGNPLNTDLLKNEYKKAAEKAVTKVRTQLLSQTFMEEKALIKKANLTYKDWEKVILQSRVGDIPAFDLYINLQKQFILEKLKEKSSDSIISDGPDLLHASYAPYCDIMRVDKRTFALLNKLPQDQKASLSTCFVKDIDALQSAIQNKISQLNLVTA